MDEVFVDDEGNTFILGPWGSMDYLETPEEIEDILLDLRSEMKAINGKQDKTETQIMNLRERLRNGNGGFVGIIRSYIELRRYLKEYGELKSDRKFLQGQIENYEDRYHFQKQRMTRLPSIDDQIEP